MYSSSSCVRALTAKVLCFEKGSDFGDPMVYSPPDSSVHGISQARILECLPFPSPGNLPDPGIEPKSLTLQTDSLPSEPPEKPINVN